MKTRIKIDSAILSLVIILTGFLYLNRGLYGPRWLDDILDIAGLIVILDGILLRMWARGHKKANSRQSNKLVLSGPYEYVRNPMYLGSFLLGSGFVLTVWPFWALPVFALLFYARFIKQIKSEEEVLTKQFGGEYAEYSEKVPRIFPGIGSLWKTKLKMKRAFNAREAFSTKEKRGLWGWPALAVVFEMFQEWMVYGAVHVKETVGIAAAAVLVYAVLFFIIRKSKPGESTG